MPCSPRKREKVDRSHKGLRQFSLKVCQKVQERGSTSYKEVRVHMCVGCVQWGDEVAGGRQEGPGRGGVPLSLGLALASSPHPTTKPSLDRFQVADELVAEFEASRQFEPDARDVVCEPLPVATLRCGPFGTLGSTSTQLSASAFPCFPVSDV